MVSKQCDRLWILNEITRQRKLKISVKTLKSWFRSNVIGYVLFNLNYNNIPVKALQLAVLNCNIKKKKKKPKITFEAARQNFIQGATASIINQFAKTLYTAGIYHILTHYSPLTSFIYFNK